MTSWRQSWAFQRKDTGDGIPAWCRDLLSGPISQRPGLSQENRRIAVVSLAFWQPNMTSSIPWSPGKIAQVFPPRSLQPLAVFPRGRTRSCSLVPLLGACTARGWASISTSKEMLPRMGLTPLDTNSILNMTIRTWHFKRWLFFPPRRSPVSPLGCQRWRLRKVPPALPLGAWQSKLV